MISHINGRLVEKTPTYVVIEAAGVGYHINISLHTFSKLGTDEACKLYTHLSIKEDAHTLFGFKEPDERETFRKLISVNGVGASTARVMLSSLTPEELSTAIVSGNVGVIKSVKGIGQKTAERIIIDLKDKMGTESGAIAGLGLPLDNKAQSESIAALQALGFPKNAVQKVVQKVVSASPDSSVEAVIKEALKHL